MNRNGFLSNNQIIFAFSMINYMKEHHSIDRGRASHLVFKHIKEIDVDNAIAQHLGVDYFALQILMEEGLIPYKPM